MVLLSAREYFEKYKKIKGATSKPWVFYPEWTGWNDFLDKEKDYISYEDLKSKVRELGITSAREYNKGYKEIKGALGAPS